jgi:tRNA dimethylallyltransferase
VAPAALPLVAIVGPTASGKSALALRLARARPAEIVSCDSLQVYRGLDIGSAKPTAEERAEVRHHLVDAVDPAEDFSAAAYSRLARAALGEIAARGRLPIVAGGTGLYLRALLRGLFEGPSRDEALRRRLSALAERFGDPRLHRLLRRVDPEAAAHIRPRDRVRVVRALEVYRATGRPISERQREGGEPLRGFRGLVVGLDPDRSWLREAVRARTHEMLARGLIEEVRGLVERYGPDLRPLRAIGYRQAVAVVRGEMTLAEAERAIVTETMRFAKRQRTWFRHQQPDVVWFAQADEAFAGILRWLEGAGPGGVGEPRTPLG